MFCTVWIMKIPGPRFTDFSLILMHSFNFYYKTCDDLLRPLDVSIVSCFHFQDLGRSHTWAQCGYLGSPSTGSFSLSLAFSFSLYGRRRRTAVGFAAMLCTQLYTDLLMFLRTVLLTFCK